MMDKAFKDLDDWLTDSDMPHGKKQVLKAAVKLFSEQGYDGTSTAQIAKESKMSQATIFKYYKSKDDLLLFIVKPIVEHILPEYGQEFAQQVKQNNHDLESLVHFIVTNRYQFLVQNKDAVIILFSQVLINNDIRNMLLDRMTQMKDIFVDNIWDVIQKTGEIRDDIDMVQFIRLLVSQIGAYFLQSQRILTITDDKQIEYNLEKIEDSIIRAIHK